MTGLALVAAGVGFLQLEQAGCSLAQLLRLLPAELSLLLQSTDSRAQLSSCGAQAQGPHSTSHPPERGWDSRSPALAGESLTTGPPGKS